MMSMEMFVAEMSVQILGHMQGPKDLIEVAWFVVDLVGNCEVSSIQVRVDVEDSNQIEHTLAR